MKFEIRDILARLSQSAGYISTSCYITVLGSMLKHVIANFCGNDPDEFCQHRRKCIVNSTYQKHMQKKQIEENYLQKATPQSTLNLHHDHNQNYLYNGCAWITKGIWQPEEDFLAFFSSSSGTSRSTTIKHYGDLCPIRVTSSQFGH